MTVKLTKHDIKGFQLLVLQKNMRDISEITKTSEELIGISRAVNVISTNPINFYFDFNFCVKELLTNQWLVYILKCKDNTLYTGVTNNLFNRIDTHNKRKGAKYTKSRTPVKFYWAKTVSLKSEALKLEYKIKQMSKLQKTKLVDNINTHDWKQINHNFELFDKPKGDVWVCSKCRQICLTNHGSDGPGNSPTYPLEFYNCEETQVERIIQI